MYETAPARMAAMLLLASVAGASLELPPLLQRQRPVQLTGSGRMGPWRSNRSVAC